MNSTQTRNNYPALWTAMMALFSCAFCFAQPRAPITIITDQSWDVSSASIAFGEYPMSAGQLTAASTNLRGATTKAVEANYPPNSKIISGSIPIWRTRATTSEMEAVHFSKTVDLGADPIRKITLEINCDDVARVYINQRLVTVDKRDGKMKDGYDDWYTFRSVSGFTYSRVYTYDVTDYFFTNVTNTIFAEVVSLAFDGNHAYFSAKLVFEFDPKPEPPRPAPSAKPAKRTPAPKSKPAPATTTAKPEATAGTATEPAKPALFEAGRDPEIDKLYVGSILELSQVNFKANDHRLDAASYSTLDALAAFLQRHSGLHIEIGGHTNLRADDSFAAELSAKRAQSVAQYLRDKGVRAERITHKGYGKSMPRINAVSKTADKANQRVEVKVTGM